MSKYQPLTERLAGHPGHEWRASFTEIEEVLGFPLPKAARTGAAWWSNNTGKAQSRAWTEPGWEVGEVDHAAGAVTFRRPVSEAELQGGSEDYGEYTPMPEVVGPEPARVSTTRPGKAWRTAALVAVGAALATGVGVLTARARAKRSG